MHSKELTYSNTASDRQEQENLGTGSDLHFTGSNRQEKNKTTEKGNITESRVSKRWQTAIKDITAMQ